MNGEENTALAEETQEITGLLEEENESMEPGEDLEDSLFDEEFDELFAGIPQDPVPEISDEERAARRQRLFGSIAYLGPVGAIVALVCGRKDPFVKFHGLQSLFTWILVTAVAILIGVSKVYETVNPVVEFLLGTVIFLFVIALLIAVIYCVLGALTQVTSCLPFIGVPLLRICGYANEESEAESSSDDEVPLAETDEDEPQVETEDSELSEKAEAEDETKGEFTDETENQTDME